MNYSGATESSWAAANLLTKSRKQLAVKIAKIVVGILLLTILFLRVDFDNLREILKACDYSYVVMGLFCFGLSILFLTIRLQILVKLYNFSWLAIMRITLISMFFNNMSTYLVGDGYKILALKQKVKALRKSVVVVLIDRISGFVVLIIYGAIYIILWKDRLWNFSLRGIKMNIRLEMVLVALLAITIITIIVFKAKLKRVISEVMETARDINKVFSELSFSDIIIITALTIGANLLLAVKISMLTSAFGQKIPLIDSAFVIFLVFTASYLPVSIGSLGVREGITVLGLASFEVIEPAAIVVAVTARIMIYLFAVIGGILFITSKNTLKNDDSS